VPLPLQKASGPHEVVAAAKVVPQTPLVQVAISQLSARQ
jgi:hypothetical protein